MPGIPETFWGALAFVVGAIIGSFLNVVIWRLPRGGSLIHPSRSYCPKCSTPLRAYDNIPLISFLLLGARCRTCRAPISWRYFWVELLTASLFLVLILHFGPTVEGVAYCLFAAALIASLFIDLEHFLIPDQLNTFALLVGIGLNVWGIASGAPNALLWGWLPRALPGAMICAGVFVLIQIVGLLLFRKDAMGDGDVKLARAIGAMLPLSQALVSFLFAIAAGAVLGTVMMVWQLVRAAKEEQQERAGEPEGGEGEEEPKPTPLSEQMVNGLCYILFCDLLLQASAYLRNLIARKEVAQERRESLVEEEDFVPGLTHIPFGPYMVVGVLLAIFFGDRLVHWYLDWAHLGR